jgi:hypothetical protein
VVAGPTTVERVSAAAHLGRLLRAAAYDELADDHPLRAFLARGVVADRGAVDDELAACLVALGLAVRRGDGLEPVARIATWDGLLIAHDPDGPADVSRDGVLGVSNTTKTVFHLTPREPVRRTLDVATGSGILALAARRHSSVVIGTDISGRSIRFSRLNAAMNDISFDCRIGDLYEPVAGEASFDLVSANLPFVVSPDCALTFRDGNRTGDEMSREAVRGAALQLAPGGVAVLLCNWVVVDGAADDDAVRRWTDDLGCDCLVIHHRTEPTHSYAKRWNEHLLSQDPSSYMATIQRWEDAYRAVGAAGIAGGAVVLRRPTSARPALFRRHDMSAAPQGDGGQQVMRMLRNAETLAESDDDALLTRSLALVPGSTVDQSMAFDGGWSMKPARVELVDSAGVNGVIEPLAIHAVLRLDGVTPLTTVCRQVAADVGLDEPLVIAATVASCRKLLEAGCLETTEFSS